MEPMKRILSANAKTDGKIITLCLIFTLISCIRGMKNSSINSPKTTSLSKVPNSTVRPSTTAFDFDADSSNEDGELNDHYIREASAFEFPWGKRLGAVYADDNGEDGRSYDPPAISTPTIPTVPSIQSSAVKPRPPVGDVPPSLRNWIPVPWIKLLSEASFRRRNPPPSESNSRPGAKPNIINLMDYDDGPNTLPLIHRDDDRPEPYMNNLPLPPPPPPPPAKQKCTCGPVTRYSSSVNHLVPSSDSIHGPNNIQSRPDYNRIIRKHVDGVSQGEGSSSNSYRDVLDEPFDAGLDAERGSFEREKDKYLLFSKKSSYSYNGQELTDENMQYVCTQFMSSRPQEKIDWGSRIRRNEPNNSNEDSLFKSSSLNFDSSTPATLQVGIKGEKKIRFVRNGSKAPNKSDLKGGSQMETKGATDPTRGHDSQQNSNGIKGHNNQIKEEPKQVLIAEGIEAIRKSAAEKKVTEFFQSQRQQRVLNGFVSSRPIHKRKGQSSSSTTRPGLFSSFLSSTPKSSVQMSKLQSPFGRKRPSSIPAAGSIKGTPNPGSIKG